MDSRKDAIRPSGELHSEKYTLPFVALLTVRGPWEVSLSRSRDPEFSFRQSTPEKHRFYPDAFTVTTEFLDLKSPQEALRFFQKYGAFQFVQKRSGRYAQSVKWSVIQQAQTDFSLASLSDSIPVGLYEFVFGQPLKVELRFRAVTPELLKADPSWIDDAAIADCEDVATAIRASIFLKRMHGFRWKRCARKNCNQIFQLETGRDRIYHSAECGHLEAVNRYNARQKNKKRRKQE
ncbi:MAG TPA: hypothetical protein VGU63_15195 [Candidatus Acidoferrales bacterium]|nr:hypothetical protein [Candidatus Acidoferrales bacterium]